MDSENDVPVDDSYELGAMASNNNRISYQGDMNLSLDGEDRVGTAK